MQGFRKNSKAISEDEVEKLSRLLKYILDLEAILNKF